MDMVDGAALAVGREFPDVKTFRNAVKEAAIAQHFELRILKSDLVRYVAKCASDGCPWRIRAAKLPNLPTFAIRSLEQAHTCGKNAQAGHHQASVDWVVSFIMGKLRHDVNYKPKDIRKDVQERYGITITYKQAWRAKERGLQAIHGSSEEGYYLLPAYCEQIRRSNPGSFAEVSIDGGDNRFQQVFVSFYASINGFLRGCLPIIGLGRFQLKSKYLGTLLSATSFDGDGGLFPLAFGVVDMESDDNWLWFLTELCKALEMNAGDIRIPPFTFLTDGQKGVSDAVRMKFPASSDAICMKFLTENINKEFKNPRIVRILWKAARATTKIEFKARLLELEEISPEAAKWLQQYPTSKWALTHFQGMRYGHLSSNADEFNQWVLEARDLPIVRIVERIHSRLILEFEERRGNCKSWASSILTPFAEKYIISVMDSASAYRVLRSDDSEFEVITPERSYIVNVEARDCSCRDWQLFGLPCSHAVAAMASSKRDVYASVEKYFTVASYGEAYANEISAIPGNKMELKRDGVLFGDEAFFVKPPKIRRAAGRPENKRMCGEDLSREKHLVRCSRCNLAGHYKSTCRSRKETS